MVKQVEIEVSEDHIDELGHANNARIVEYFERGRLAWYNSIGLFSDPSSGGRLGTVVVSLKVNFRRECFEGDVLSVRTEPWSRGHRSYVLHQQIRNHAGAVVADADVTSVIMDLDRRVSVDMPAELAVQFRGKVRRGKPTES